MSWELLVFLSITIVRQIPQFWLEFRAKGTKVLHDSGSRSTLVMFGVYIAIWVVALVMVALDTPGTLALSAGLALLGIGVCIRFVALAQLGLGYSGNIIIREEHALTTSGIYGLVRHPLHLALLIELLGMIVYSEVWWLVPLWAGLAGVIHFRNIDEDRVIKEAFGEEAIEYQAAIPGMNPLGRWVRRGGG